MMSCLAISGWGGLGMAVTVDGVLPNYIGSMYPQVNVREAIMEQPLTKLLDQACAEPAVRALYLPLVRTRVTFYNRHTPFQPGET